MVKKDHKKKVVRVTKMSSRKSRSPSSPKNGNNHMQRALKLLSQINEMTSCVVKNCKKQKEEFDKKHKEKNEKLKNILFEIAKKPSTKLTKEALKIKLDMLKSEEKRRVVDCQLEKCYKQTKNVLQTTFEVFTDPSIPVPAKMRELGKKYKEIFKKVITAKQLIQSDIDTLKIKK